MTREEEYNKIEREIAKLVERYSCLQKKYHGDTGWSNNIEAKISALEDRQRKLMEEV